MQQPAMYFTYIFMCIRILIVEYVNLKNVLFSLLLLLKICMHM